MRSTSFDTSPLLLQTPTQFESKRGKKRRKSAQLRLLYPDPRTDHGTSEVLKQNLAPVEHVPATDYPTELKLSVDVDSAKVTSEVLFANAERNLILLLDKPF